MQKDKPGLVPNDSLGHVIVDQASKLWGKLSVKVSVNKVCHPDTRPGSFGGVGWTDSLFGGSQHSVFSLSFLNIRKYTVVLRHI